MWCKFLLIVAIGALLFKYSSQAKPAACNEKHSMAGMPQDSAACMAYMPTWTYNAAKNACEEFIFGGCGGNANQFGSRAECEKSCKD